MVTARGLRAELYDRSRADSGILVAQKKTFRRAVGPAGKAFGEGREGVEPSRDGFAIRCLSHLATAPSEIWECWARFREPSVPDFYNECIGMRSRLLQPIPGEISEEAIWAFFGTLVHPDGFLLPFAVFWAFW